jgi:hypothetical protein
MLWGDHDTLYGHHRRYRTPEVRARLEEAGFSVSTLTYFEPLFFAPLWVYRNLKKLFVRDGGIEKRDDFVALPRPVNALLTELIAAERFALRYVRFPFGVTILALAHKPGPTA